MVKPFDKLLESDWVVFFVKVIQMPVELLAFDGHSKKWILRRKTTREKIVVG